MTAKLIRFRPLRCLLAAFWLAGPLAAAPAATVSLLQAVAPYPPPPAGWSRPGRVAVDGSGNVYVCDPGLGVLCEISQGGGPAVLLAKATAPDGVAVDGAGDIFYLDGGSLWMKSATSSTFTNIQTFSNPPGDLAVEAGGTLYFIDNSQLMAASATDGYQPHALAFNYPPGLEPAPGTPGPPLTALALDGLGNFFIVAGGFPGQAIEVATYSSTTKSVSIVSQWGPSPETAKTLGDLGDLAADGTGGVYCCTSSGVVVQAIPPTSGSTWTVNPVATDLGSLASLARVGPGTLCVTADSGTMQDGTAVQPNASLVQLAPDPVQFGTLPFGAVSSTQTLYFQFATPPAITPQAQVTIQGALGRDFQAAGTVTLGGDIAAVAVTFEPATSGSSAGSLTLLDSTTGLPLTTALLAGSALRPRIGFPPGIQTVFPYALDSGGVTIPEAVAVDAAGEVFIGDPNASATLKVVPPANLQSQVGGAGNLTVALAVDGAGNVYVCDRTNQKVLKETFAPGTRAGTGTYQEAILDGTRSAPCAVAVDGAGNVYVADSGTGSVFVDTPSATGYDLPATALVTGLGAGNPPAGGLAVDGAGDVYVVGNPGSGQAPGVLRIAPDGSQTTVTTGLTAPGGLALDGNGILYVCDLDPDAAPGTNPGRVLRLFPTGPSSYVQDIRVQGLGKPGGVAPSGVAAGRLGDLFVADPAVHTLWEVDFADDPGVAFQGSGLEPITGTLQVENTGNWPLSFAAGTNPAIGQTLTATILATDGSPSLVTGTENVTQAGSYPAIFAEDPASAGFTGTPLGAGSERDLVFDFQPPVSGLYVGSAVLTEEQGTAHDIVLRGVVPIVLGESAVDVELAPPTLDQTYDGRPRTVTASVDSPFLPLTGTYAIAYYTCPQTAPHQPPPPDCRIPFPVDAGTYYVYATFTSSGGSFSGSAYGTLVVAKAPVAVKLHHLRQTFDGAPRVVTATTRPRARVEVTYTGIDGTDYPLDSRPPRAPGHYAVAATVVDPNHQGSAAGTLVVREPRRHRPIQGPLRNNLSRFRHSATAPYAGTWINGQGYSMTKA